MRIITTRSENLDLNRPHLLTSSLHSISPAGSKIPLPTIDGIQFEHRDQIIYLEASSNYTIIHFKGGRKIMVCKTLMEVELIINRPYQFVRIHRSNTINLEKIQKYFKGKGGYVEMDNGSTINVSIGKKSYFLAALKKYFG